MVRMNWPGSYLMVHGSSISYAVFIQSIPITMQSNCWWMLGTDTFSVNGLQSVSLIRLQNILHQADTDCIRMRHNSLQYSQMLHQCLGCESAFHPEWSYSFPMREFRWLYWQ